MIELSFGTAFMLYLLFTLTLILGLWFYSHYQTKHKEILPYEQDLYICEYCHFAYLEEPTKDVNRCPQCHSLNKKNRYFCSNKLH